MRVFLTFCMMYFCVIYSFNQLEAADFHVILVGDALSKDIFHATKSDIQKIRTEVQAIAKSGNYNLKLTVFYDKKSNASDVLQSIKKMKPKSDDLVLFYYSGHGYRTSINEGDPWPNLDFPYENKGIRLKKIIDLIKIKKAGLSIILADCCNLKIPQKMAPVILKGTSHVISAKQKRLNYRSLFCATSGVIAIASARAGKPSYCTVEGSFYTNSFLASLRTVVETSKSKVNWSAVFEGAFGEMKTILGHYKLEQDAVVYTSF